MATPNLVNVTTVTPFTIAGAVTAAGADVIDVPADKAYKINSIIIANVDGTNAQTVTATVSVDNGANYYAIASTVSVPADATIVLINKDSQIYLDETDLLKLAAGADSDLEYIVSGEILDDA